MKTTAASARFLALCLVPAFAVVLSASAAFGLDLDPGEIRGKSSKEPITVLQNRYFTKTLRPEVGLLVGALMDEAYLETQVYGMRTGVFITEWLGIEAQMVRTKVSASQDRKALDGMKFRPLDDTQSGDAVPNDNEIITVSPEPEVNPIRSMTDFYGVMAPFYGKLNLLNKWIVYTDMCLTAGLSMLETDQGDKTGMILGIGERFYVGQALSFRIDFRDRIFSEERAGNKARRNSYSIDFGTSYFFN